MRTAEIRLAAADDVQALRELDTHVSPHELEAVVARGRVMLAIEDGSLAALLRWSLFWDEFPFMNMLMVRADRRGRGIGTALTRAWLHERRAEGYPRAMTSSLATERAQHLYRRLGFLDCGELRLPGEPDEILFRIELS